MLPCSVAESSFILKLTRWQGSSAASGFAMQLSKLAVAVEARRKQPRVVFGAVGGAVGNDADGEAVSFKDSDGDAPELELDDCSCALVAALLQSRTITGCTELEGACWLLLDAKPEARSMSSTFERVVTLDTDEVSDAKVGYSSWESRGLGTGLSAPASWMEVPIKLPFNALRHRPFSVLGLRGVRG